MRWKQLLQRDDDPVGCKWRFANMGLQKAQNLFSLQSYLQKYGDEQKRRDCEEWKLTLVCGDNQWELLCCPEDHRCKNESCVINRTCCTDCWLPQCDECSFAMYNQGGPASLPPASLANDMMIYYAPAILYTEQVTIMEMVCASVCLTSMMCFSLEKVSWQPRFR